MGDTANPRVWTNATVAYAPVGSTGPTDATSSLDTAFKDVGLLHEDGLSLSRDVDTNEIYAYGGVLVRSVKSKAKASFKFTMLEDNKYVFPLVWPGSSAATSTGVTTRTLKTPTASNPKAFVLTLVDGSVNKRFHIPRGEVTEVAEVKISDTDVAAYEVTVMCYSAANGTIGYEITDDTQAAVS